MTRTRKWRECGSDEKLVLLALLRSWGRVIPQIGKIKFGSFAGEVAFPPSLATYSNLLWNLRLQICPGTLFFCSVELITWHFPDIFPTVLMNCLSYKHSVWAQNRFYLNYNPTHFPYFEYTSHNSNNLIYTSDSSHISHKLLILSIHFPYTSHTSYTLPKYF